MRSSLIKLYGETFSTILFGTTLALFIYNVSRDPRLLDKRGVIFTIVAIVILAILVVLLFWAIIVHRCPQLREKCIIKKLEIDDFHPDVTKLLSFFLPIIITFLIANWLPDTSSETLKTEDSTNALIELPSGNPWTGEFMIIFWILCFISIVCAITTICASRRLRHTKTGSVRSTTTSE